MKKFYDYEEIGGCEYPIFPGGSPDHEHGCGKPASYRIFFWWEDISLQKTRTDVMRLCEKHFYKVIESLEAL